MLPCAQTFAVSSKKRSWRRMVRSWATRGTSSICAMNFLRFAMAGYAFFVINLPPQHLKTFCTSCLIAWYLGHHPKDRVLVIGYTGEHAESISRRVRNTMRSKWYQDAFRTQISPSRSSASNFETTAGGGIHAVSANGSVTGRPADLIVYDDPVQITDCNNLEHLERVNRQFDSLIMSRLSNPAKGCVVIVAHTFPDG